MASALRDIISVYDKNLDLISIGAYKPNTNPRLDYAISKIDKVNDFLKQGINENFGFEDTLKRLKEILD